MLSWCWHSRERGVPQTEIVLWTTPEEPPEALQASECGELLDFARASCLILAQRQPGKLLQTISPQVWSYVVGPHMWEGSCTRH